MLHTEIVSSQNLICVSPEGKVSKEAFESLSETINNYINTHDQIPGLVIVSEHLPDWENFAALQGHIKLVREHEKIIPKIAFVSDSAVLSILPAIADHFVSAKIRHFHADHLAQAKDWVAAAEDHPGAFKLIEGLPNNVIGIEAHGIITAKDYEKTLTPLIEEKLTRHDKINLLYVVGPEMDSWSADGIWDDAKLGLMHLADFGKIALVSDVGWVRRGVKLFAPLFRGHVQVFDLADLPNAKAWVIR